MCELFSGRNLGLVLILITLNAILSFGCAQSYDDPYIVKPTPALRLNDGDDLTTVLLVNNNGQGRLGDNHGRFLSVRPEVGLLTSTARTFIQGGITTEYATQVVGTTLNNGRLYAQYLKKSSRVLFENGHVAPSVVTSWVGASEQTATPSYLQSHNDLLNAEAPDWQDIDDSLIGSLTKRHEFVGNTDYLKLKSANTQTLKVSASPSLAKKEVATELTAFKLANRSKFSEENARLLAAHKVLPIGDLPTITVKNHFEPSGYQSIEQADNDNGIRTNTEEERTAKLYYQQLLKQKKQSEPLNAAPKRVFSTVTYYGFADFTTIVGDSVIVFSPSTSQAKQIVGHLTTLKGMATISENIGPATKTSTLIEATSVLHTIQALATAVSREESSSSELIDVASLTEIETQISPSKQTVLAVAPSLDLTTEHVVTPQETLNETKPMFSLPTDQEILAIYASLSKVQAQAGATVEATSTVEQPPKSVSTESKLQVHGGATTIFVDDDPFANFVEPTMVTQVSSKSTIATTDVNYEQSSEEPTTINNTESSEETTTLSFEDETSPTTLDSTTETDESETVQSVEVNKEDNLDLCSEKGSQVITLTHLPKTLTVLKTHILDDKQNSFSIETSRLTTYDPLKTTKYYCLQATQTMESPQLERAILPDSTTKMESATQIESKFESESDSDDETTTIEAITESLTKMSHSEPKSKEESEDNYVTESETDDDYDIDNDSQEYDIIYKTLYTTYTYLTTFFQGESTTISSHTEIVSNIITSTLANDQEEGTTAILNLSTDQIISITPTVSTAYQTKYMIPEELESLIHVSEEINSKDDLQQTGQLDDSKYIKTFYTTYTYYTTIFADSETDIMSRTEVFTNFVTDLAPSATTEAKTASSTEQAMSESLNVVTPSISELLLESSLPSAVREQAERVTLITDVRSSSSNGGQEVIGKSKESIDDQVSSESNTEEILPSATLLLQTSFTTFTFYTTMYAANSTNVVSRLETVTNIATETLQPTKMLSQEDGTLPITYFTTFTYWTKLAKDGEINTISREETVSNVIEPTKRIAIETNENLNTLLSTESTINDPIMTGVNDIPDPTTYYTTYTYYTTSYEANKTFTASRFETVTNVVTPTEEKAIVVVTKPDETTEEPVININSSSVINIDKKPLLLFYDYKQIIDADEVSTLYFTTEVQKTVNDEGQPIELTSSTSSLYIDETKKLNLATGTESLLSSRQYKTGLVRLIEGTRIGNSTTTLYQSKVIGTIIDNRYAQIIESTSSFLFENAIPLATVTPTETLVENIESTKVVELSQTATIVESSVISEEEDETEDYSAVASNSRSPNSSKKKTFAPVIRPFASRNRPTFAPKQKTLSASSATIITRSDITPTITATPALKTAGRYSSSRRVGSNVPNNSNLISQSTSRRLFGRPIKPSTTLALSGISSSSSTAYVSTRNRFASSSRATPVSSSKRLNINPSFRSSSLNFRASAGQRIRPSAPLSQSAATSATSAIAPGGSNNTDLEEESSTEDQVQQSDEEEVTTENSRRNQNPLLRFRRPLNRPSGFTPIPRANTPPATISPRRNPLSGRVKAQTTTTTTTTTTPRTKTRTFQRPTLSSLQSRTRPQNNIFPPRGLFQRQQATSEISELNSNDKSAENNSEYDDNDDGEDDDEDSDLQNESDRRRRSSHKKIENLTTLIRSRRQIDSLKNRFRFRRPTTTTTEEPPNTQSSDDLSETSPTLKINTRFGSRYQASTQHRSPKVTQSTSSAASLRSNIRPTRPTTPRAQFTLRDKDTNSKSNARTVGTTSNFRRPPTKPWRNQAVANNGLVTSRRLKSYNNNVETSIGRSIGSSGNSARSRNGNTSARGRGTTRGRVRNDYNQDISVSELESLTITVTHVIPTEIALPVVNGHQTEYKNIVTGKTSLETLGPHQYTQSLGHNGLTSIYLTREDSSINQAGNTELTKYLLHDSATTTVTFTPTTIRGRKTSFSHVLPSTVYSVENVVSTLQPQISGNAPLANILLSQLLLGNINLPSNPLLGALGQPQLTDAALEPSKPLLPVTEYRTHTSTYVTTIYNGKSTIVPLTFQGKKILTTVFDTTAQTITATEYSVDTIINTPTVQHQQQQQQQQVAQVNSLLLQQLLLQQQQQQQQQQQSVPQITQTTSAHILLTENLQDLDDVPRFDLNINDDIIVPNDEQMQPKSSRKKPRKSHKSHKRNKPRPVEESSVITLYVSGRRPGEFSTILSTVQNSNDLSASLQKRQAQIQPTDIYNDPADFYEQEGSERFQFFVPLAPEKDVQEIGQIDANKCKLTNCELNNDSTALLETIIGDVDLWYAKSTKQAYKATSSSGSDAYNTLNLIV